MGWFTIASLVLYDRIGYSGFICRWRVVDRAIIYDIKKKKVSSGAVEPSTIYGDISLMADDQQIPEGNVEVP